MKTISVSECPDPGVPNSIFAGDKTVGGNAAIICNTGYEGGDTIICEADLNWQSLPTCTPRGEFKIYMLRSSSYPTHAWPVLYPE